MKIYISGPMTGLPDFNYPAFNKAEECLKRDGYEVLNPARNFDGRTDLPREAYMRKDIEMLMQADAIAFLDGWDGSTGARQEKTVAEALGLKMYELVERAGGYFMVSLEHPASPALEAHAIVNGARRKTYGHPKGNFGTTAQMWNAYIDRKYAHDSEYGPLTLDASDVAMMMVLVKVAREANAHHHDNLVDICGYAEAASLC